jgi:hypothetical protein
VLEDYFSRPARSLTANNPAFEDFYALPGSRAAKVRRGRPVLDKANSALGYLEELSPDSIGEACFIERNGPENAAWSAANGRPSRTSLLMNRPLRSSGRRSASGCLPRPTLPPPACESSSRNGSLQDRLAATADSRLRHRWWDCLGDVIPCQCHGRSEQNSKDLGASRPSWLI